MCFVAAPWQVPGFFHLLYNGAVCVHLANNHSASRKRPHGVLQRLPRDRCRNRSSVNTPPPFHTDDRRVVSLEPAQDLGPSWGDASKLYGRSRQSPGV